MKKHNKEIEQYRIRKGVLGSDASYGNNGVFITFVDGQELRIQASDGEGWDHVSVSTANRCPTWDEMCWVKDLFFSSSEIVIQYHPAKKDYVDNHSFCLHMWKPHGVKLPTPPTNLVGVL